MWSIAFLIILTVFFIVICCGYVQKDNSKVENNIESNAVFQAIQNTIMEHMVIPEKIETIGTDAVEIEEMVEKYEKKELSDLDFQVEYEGIVITKDTSKEELVNSLGYPDDFETYNVGVDLGKSDFCSWALVYPDYISESQGSAYIRINLESELDIDDAGNLYELYSHIESICLEGVKTTKGIKNGDTLEKVLQEYGCPDHMESKYNRGYIEVSYIKDDVELIFTIGLFKTVTSIRLVFPHERVDVNAVVEIAEKYEKKELTGLDFQVEYEGFTITKNITEEELISHLGYPENFTSKADGGNGGLISNGNGYMRWNLVYPEQESDIEIGQPQLRVVLLSKTGVDDNGVLFLKDSYIASVWFSNIETVRGIKTKDTLEKVLEEYGHPDVIQKYSANSEYAEILYTKDNTTLVFVIGPSMRAEHIFLDINMEKAEQDQFGNSEN